MRNTNTNKALAMSFAILLSTAAMAAPIQAQAAARVPGTCDLLKNTACDPGSLLDAILDLFSFN